MFYTVAMPIYNAAKTLDKCIQAIIDQDEKDYELILVNDGSNDNSLEICHEWEKRYPDVIKVIDKANSGSLETRRRCITEARGDYLYIVDSDDIICNSSALKMIRKAIEKSGADMVIFPFVTNDGKRFNFPFENNTVYEGEKLKEIYSVFLKDFVLNHLWNKVFSRELIDWDNEDDYNVPLTNGTDLYQTIPLISRAEKILYVDEVFYQYTFNGSSITHTFKPQIFKSMMTNFERLIKYSREWTYKPDDYEFLIRYKLMLIASTSAAKIRFKNNMTKEKLIEFLKAIGENQDFIDMYTLKGLEAKRKLILWLLYHKKYNTLIRFMNNKAD